MSAPEQKNIDPVRVSDTCWLYGERGGLCVVKEILDADGKLIRTVTIDIPWADIGRARGPMKK